jgi:hypothetical protein
MARTKVCDFCLAESKGMFSHKPERLSDGHYICKNCKSVIHRYGLPVKYDIFQKLVTGQKNMRDMMMDAHLENMKSEDAIMKYFPYPSILMHGGEHCVSAVKATLTVDKNRIPKEDAVRSIDKIQKGTIHNIPDTSSKTDAQKVTGMLYETEAALYFLSDKFVNCHRLGYVTRNTGVTDRVEVVTPTKTFTYKVDHADLFFMRERFWSKVNAKKHNKHTHLIYINNADNITITPGVYDVPKELRPGIYKVRAIKDAGLHIHDNMGRVKDYYENEEHIEVSEGGVLECTGEYQLQWIGENTTAKD